MKFLSNVLLKAGLIVEGTTDLQGTATAVTPTLSDSSTKIATTAFVKGQGYVLNNIYSADGSLTGNRTITLNGNYLDIAGVTKTRFFANGNVVIDGESPVDAGFKLDVGGTARVSNILTVGSNVASAAVIKNTSTDGSLVYAGSSFSNSSIPTRTIIISTVGTYSGLTGGSNLFVGRNAGGSVTSGTSNVFIGKGAGVGITTGGSNVMISSSDATNLPSSLANSIHLVAGNGYKTNDASSIPSATHAFIGGGFNTGVAIKDFYFGQMPFTADAGSGFINIAFYAPSGLGTDIGGANFTIAAGRGTGAGTPGDLIFSTSTAGVSSTSTQALTTRLRISGGTGAITASSLAGSGSRMVVADSSGVLSTQAIPAGITGSLTSGYVPKATGASSLADGLIYDTGSAVLIGTQTAGSAKFMVYSTSPDNHYQAVGSGPSFRFADTITSPSYTGIIALVTSSNQFITGAAAGDMVLANNTTSSIGNFIFGTGATERMRITPTGNISINNTNNTYRFDVTGTVRFTGQLRLESTITNGTHTYTLPSATGTLALTSDIPSVTGFVPYTGATANVNLGTFDLTADVITGATGSFTSSGSGNTLVITHSSGSGIALNIEKGGNGEGLYINKTSGTGNAATIIGTLNATTLVKSGGTSTQFLKADGSVDTNTYLTASSLTAYVPYTGATADVNLGTNSLTGKDLTVGGAGTTAGRLSFTQRQSALLADSGTTYITAAGTTDLYINFSQGNGNYKVVNISASLLTNNTLRYHYLPDKDGTFAMISDIPSLSGYVPTSRTITINGTSFDLSANRSYSVGTVTSVGLSSATSGVTIGSTPITTSGTITLSIATASGSQQGLLSSTDWTTFNNKQNALTNPVTGSGTTNYLPKFTGTSTIGNSQVFDNGSGVGIGTATITGKLNVSNGNAHLNNYFVTGTSAGWDIKTYFTGGNSGSEQFIYLGYAGAETNAYIQRGSNGRLEFGTAATSRMIIDASGNLGLGVTPSAWASVIKAFQIGDRGNLFFGYGSLFNTNNAFFNGSNWIYQTTNAATLYEVGSSSHIWYQAPSGTAGNAISFTQAMTLNASGRLLLGTTDDNGARLQVNGDITTGDASTISSVSNFLIVRAATNLILDGNTGSVNIRTNNSDKLVIANSGAATFSSSVTTNGVLNINTESWLQFQGNNVLLADGVNTYLQASGSGEIRFRNNAASNLLRLANNGAATFSSSVQTTGLLVGTSSSAGYLARIYGGNGSQLLLDTTSQYCGVDIANTGSVKGGLSWDNTNAFFGLYTNGSIPMTFQTNNTERMRITSGGNVGIGTTSPNTVLDVNTGINTSSATAIMISHNTTGAVKPGASFGLSIQNGGESTNAADLWFRTASGGSLTERMRITSGGGVVIGGTVASNVGLTIYGSNAATIYQTPNTGTGASTGFYVGHTGDVSYVWNYNNYPTVFATNNTERMRITSGGNVGIGTTSPDYKLQVNSSQSLLKLLSTSAVFGSPSINLLQGAIDTVISATNNGLEIGTWSAHPIIFRVSSTGSTEAMRITSGGDVGIGTTSPVTRLNLAGSSPQYITLTNGGADGVPNAVQGGIIGQARTSNNNLAQMASILFRNQNSGAWYLGEITFNTNSSDGTNPSVTPGERMRINSDGYVGINTASPSNLLHLAGASATPSLRLGSVSSGFHWDIGRENLTTGDFVFNNANGGGTSERMRITVGGNVGIGTTSPGWKLSVEGTTGTSIQDALMTLKVTNAAHNVGMLFINSGNTASFNDLAGIYAKIESGNAKGYLGFYTRNSDGDNSGVAERMRITSGGVTQLKPASGQLALEIFNGATSTGAMIGDADNFILGGQTGKGLVFCTNNLGQEKMRITSGGDVLVNATATTQGAKFYVNGIGAFGSVYVGALGTGTVYSNAGFLTNTNPSDYRLKNTIKPLTYGLNEVLQLNPKTFYYNDDATRLKYGFIAQEVKEVMPDLVRRLGSDNDYLGLETEGIWVTLVNAIKEQQAQINELKSQLNK